MFEDLIILEFKGPKPEKPGVETDLTRVLRISKSSKIVWVCSIVRS